MLFSGSGQSGSTVRLINEAGQVLASQVLIANGYFMTVTLADGVHKLRAAVSDVAGNLGASAALQVTVDRVAPSVSTAGSNFELGTHPIALTFTEDVSASLATNDLLLKNLTTNTAIDRSSMSLAYAFGNIATLTFPGLVNGRLADGDYRLTVESSSVSDVAGNLIATDHDYDFFVLAGDGNRDRTIGIGDFAILASRFNLPGTFSQGDFNYSGTTEIGDFAILASRFNTGLPASSDSPARIQAAVAGDGRSAGDKEVARGRKVVFAEPKMFSHRPIDGRILSVIEVQGERTRQDSNLQPSVPKRDENGLLCPNDAV
jgi:hypothetical protein